MYWNDLNTHLKRQYGCKVYKLALSSGCSCPNREERWASASSSTRSWDCREKRRR